MKELPLVKPEAYGGQHLKYHHHALSGVFWLFFHFIIINLFDWSGIQIWNRVWGRLKWILWRINLYITIINNMMIKYTHDINQTGLLSGGEVRDFKWTDRGWMFQPLVGSVGSLPWSVFNWFIFLLILGGSNLGPWMIQASSFFSILL